MYHRHLPKLRILVQLNQLKLNVWRKEMKKYFYTPLFILLALSITNCRGSGITQLEATNIALNNQVNSLMTQLTQQASSPIQTDQKPVIKSTESVAPTEFPSASPSSLSTEASSVIPPTLIFSGSGTITPFSNKTVYPLILFGSANVHMTCDPNDATDGNVWIDNKSYLVSCNANSESWSPWKLDITVGDHYIYSLNPNDKYEFWTIGTTPFTIRNKQSLSDYMFIINNSGIYNLSANLIKGMFNLYLTCEGAQNFNYEITASTTIPLVLNPARCELLIRDSPPGTLTPGEIEVSLEFVK
jgi:hypothetical protein